MTYFVISSRLSVKLPCDLRAMENSGPKTVGLFDATVEQMSASALWHAPRNFRRA